MSIDLNDVKAGKYELVALRWRQILSKPGEPFDYVQYHQGDVVDLNIDDARRLVQAGAVKPVGSSNADDEGEGSDGGSEPTVKEILADVGDDADKARAALESETSSRGDKARKTLVDALQAVIDKADASA